MSEKMEDEDVYCHEVLSHTSINDLPEEIIELILMKLSPYRDLKAASSVCHLWYRLVKGK